MKYNFGDHVDGSKNYERCPECGALRTTYAKRPQLDSRDANGHWWHIDLATMTVQKGPGK